MTQDKINKYDKVEKEVYNTMISNGLFIEPSKTIASMAAMIEMLIDRQDMLESRITIRRNEP